MTFGYFHVKSFCQERNSKLFKFNYLLNFILKIFSSSKQKLKLHYKKVYREKSPHLKHLQSAGSLSLKSMVACSLEVILTPSGS